MLRMLDDVTGVTVAGVFAENAMGAAMRLADEIGVFATCDRDEFASVKGVDILIDVADDARVVAGLAQRMPVGVEVLGPTTTDLVRDLLAARVSSQEHERDFAALQLEYTRNRGHERRLHASKAALEDANADLETRLAEIYFTHEFFKALTRFTSTNDVCSLIVDGLAGVLGAEISCVYLFNEEDRTLRLRASQGRPDDAFRPVVPVSDTVLGMAFRDRQVAQSQVRPGTTDAGWISADETVCSQAAVSLVAGDKVFGVVVIAFSMPRKLTELDLERFAALANQASLSLQNSLLLAELERLSVTDRLTQLYNHGYFYQRLEEELGRSSRFGHPMSVIMIDIDDFKVFNDRYGHPRGDDVLKAVSAVIRSSLRDMDVAARYGGEEFIVVLPETDCEGAAAVAERIRCDIEAHQVLTEEFGKVGCTVSSGVAAFPEHASTAPRLVEFADRALYSAKRNGKNRVETAIL